MNVLLLADQTINGRPHLRGDHAVVEFADGCGLIQRGLAICHTEGRPFPAKEKTGPKVGGKWKRKTQESEGVPSLT
jgi:hypothetical protein